MRVCDLTADDRDQISLAGRNDGFGVLRGADMRLGRDDRVLDDGLQLRRQGCCQLFSMGERRDDRLEFKIASRSAGDVIDMAGCVVQGDDFAQSLGRKRHRIGGGIADGESDDEILAAGAADAFDQQPRKPRPVFKRAAPLIIAFVRPRRPELIQQRMVGGPHLDPLKPAGLSPQRRHDMRLQQFVDFRVGHPMRAVAVVIRRPTRRRPVRRETEVRIAMRANVVKLLQNDGARIFHRPGDLLKMRNDSV